MLWCKDAPEKGVGGFYEIMGVMQKVQKSHPQFRLQQFATFMEFEPVHFSHLHVSVSEKMCLFSLSSQCQKSFFIANFAEFPTPILCFCTKPPQSTQIIIFLSVPGTEGWEGNVLLDISAWLGALRLLPEASPSPGVSWLAVAGARCVQGCVLQVSEDLRPISSSEY